MKKFRRRILLIDRKVQGALAIRVVGYWLFALLTTWFFLVLWNVWSGPARPFEVVFDEVYQNFAAAAVISLMVLPIVVMDVLRVSNRFAGPAYRLKLVLRDLAEGKEVRPLTLREADFWQEIAADLNRVAARLPQATNHQAVAAADDHSPAPAHDSGELVCR
jgi:hypothetical protein